MISNPENCLDCVTCLWFALARLILVILLEMTSPNMIGWKKLQSIGNRTYKRSVKLWQNIPMKVMMWLYVKSNHSGYFKTHHEEYRRHISGHGEASSGCYFSLYLLKTIKISHSTKGRSKYYDGQEIYPGPQQSCDARGQNYLSLRRTIMEVIWAKMGEGKFTTTNHLLALRKVWCDRQKFGMTPTTPN